MVGHLFKMLTTTMSDMCLEETINLETNKTHIVSAPLSHVFSEPNIKVKNIETLPLAAKFLVKQLKMVFWRLNLAGYQSGTIKA